MLKIYKTNETLEELSLEKVEENCWFNLVKPTAEELKTVAEIANVPLDFLSAALDENEHSRIEFEDDYFLVITNIPLVINKNSFDTLPLGIVITEKYFITVCLKENRILDSFTQSGAKNFSTSKKTHFLFMIFLKSAEFYLRYMRYINHLTDEIEVSLRKSLKNKNLFELFELERSLVYFITALKDNHIITQKILRMRKNNNFQNLIYINEEDEELLEDAIIENSQAIEMVEMHSNILSGMMDAFASIISNNLNIVMKVLTLVTILVAIPTMVASFWGMNVHVPFNDSPWGFAFVVSIAVVTTAITAFVFRRLKMF